MKEKVIPYGKQSITQEDIDAVVKVLRSDYLTQGPEVKAFENDFASYVRSRYAVAVSNGTAALHLNAMALNLAPGDKVITTPITFAASANCVRYCGGEVVFADIDPDTYLLDINKVRKLLEADSQKEIKGIIPVDFAGRSVDMEAFRALADEYDCWIIEDACHAPGAYFVNSSGEEIKAGSGKYADLAIFSFHPVKHIAAGEGGMITTNDQNLYKKLLKLRTHGITKNDGEYKNPVELAIGTTQDSKLKTQDYPYWYMEMQDLGYNYRLSDINCALGRSQLNRAEQGLQRRREIASFYNTEFQKASFINEHSGLVEGHAYHLYVIEVEDRVGLYNYLRKNNVYCQIHYVPTHLMPYYQQFGWKAGDFPHAENYYAHCMSLPMYPTLEVNDQKAIVDLIKSYYA